MQILFMLLLDDSHVAIIMPFSLSYLLVVQGLVLILRIHVQLYTNQQ